MRNTISVFPTPIQTQARQPAGFFYACEVRPSTAMKLLLPLLTVLAMSCAGTPVEQVIAEANACVAYYSVEMDVPIANLPHDTLVECWAEADKRMDFIEARQNRQDRKRVQHNDCPKGLIDYCNSWGICSCMSYDQIMRTLGM